MGSPPAMPFNRFKPQGFALQFTPAEWRVLLEDISFLGDSENRYAAPRRFMGLPVRIVPDHSAGYRGWS